ncbi:MAG TPA: DciA family protein [Candidatus Acidoferrales bacterium]|nr:DciA family protein [Candidatus Acidoferrales bacterium]
MERARNLLQKIVAQSLRGVPDNEAAIAAWPFAAGGSVAEKTEAVAFRDGVLEVRVPDANWRNQLQDMAAGFLSRLNQYSKVRVRRIEFTLAPTSTQQNSHSSELRSPGNPKDSR